MALHKTVKASQAGATLIVGLIMVLVMTVIGLSAIRGSGLQEQMAGNMRDKQLAFQAAEAALREAESNLDAPPAAVPIGNQTGFVESLDASSSVFWQDFSNWQGLVATYSENIDHTKNRPQYLVEAIDFYSSGTDGSSVDLANLLSRGMERRYRVTARAVGGTTDAVVILQSNYR